MSAAAWWILGALAIFLCLAALARPRGRRGRREGIAAPPAPPARELDSPLWTPPAPMQATDSPLAPFLAKALDRALPPAGQGREVAWTHEEVQELGTRVVQRINNRTPGLGLGLVSFERVSKVVDSAGTLRYEFDAQLHSAPRRLSTRVTVKADVAEGRETIRDIAVHGARADTSAVAGSGGLADHVGYAAYEPVVRYEPNFA